jgi:hypothetical protein
MTAIPFESQCTNNSAVPQVWRCASCDCIHLHVGQVLLTFTQDEFANFAQEVVESFCVRLDAAFPSIETSDEPSLFMNPLKMTN